MGKWVLRIAGLIAIAMGLIWIGQGTGWLTYTLPGRHPSFMIGETNWIYFGGALAVLGLLIIWRSRR